MTPNHLKEEVEEESSILMLPVILDGINTRKDRTVTIKVETNELTPEQAGILHSFLNKALIVAIKDSENLSALEQDALKSCEIDIYENGKTPSQRLRSVMYKTFLNNAEGFKDFNNYYVSKMEQIITHYKGKLPNN